MAMHPGIAALAQIMPTDTGIDEQIDWAGAEHELDTRLPADYRSFLETYGADGINRVAYILRPVPAPDSLYAEGSIAEDTPGAQDTWHHTPEYRRPDVAPEDIMIWGRTPGPDILCWVTTGEDPNQWPVLVCGRHTKSRWTLYPCGMAEFLINLVTDQYDDAISIRDTRPPRFLHWREEERLIQAGIFDYYPEV
ncbi:SMI1/KNR4 family protein [Streptomyces sp. LS1784]|uniref:SMI1/KNR4 family protein n=1 Tax=Streptomyces sp. LS1784 TaxID=2851533 RepID=UPI001CD02C7C|nr:SMI1/KNR4 family protein [Streptomyces sp. LS1784]